METKLKSQILKEFTEAVETLANPAIRRWREQGGKVATYNCSYVPEEIITAAGLVPLRMRAPGSTGTELSDTYLSNINCSFCRHVFNTALRGDYEFIEGAILTSKRRPERTKTTKIGGHLTPSLGILKKFIE